jgi:hypothetical protein
MMQISERLNDILIANKGTRSIVVSDRDGVEILSTPSDALSEGDSRYNSQIVSTIFSLTHEQCEKLDEFKKANFLLSEYGKSVAMIQANSPPLVITVKADRDMVSDGQLMTIVENVQTVFSSVKPQLAAVA